jgi:hypothetical protein
VGFEPTIQNVSIFSVSTNRLPAVSNKWNEFIYVFCGRAFSFRMRYKTNKNGLQNCPVFVAHPRLTSVSTNAVFVFLEAE